MANGLLEDAEADARQAVAHADRSGNEFLRMASRATAADTLHQAGRRGEAGALFADAERLQQKRHMQFDLLYSLWGYRYCDWLLAPAERGAWRAILHSTEFPPAGALSGQERHAATFTEVERRATATLGWAKPSGDLISIALDYLTLARVGLIRAVLTRTPLNLAHVDAAVHGLRSAGQVDYLTRGLLTAALCHFVRGESEAARGRLDEVQQIAERGPMPLYLADVHLHRARMFRDRVELAKASALIRDLRYGRRYDELADAEEALGTT